jgi:hypothetical protein
MQTLDQSASRSRSKPGLLVKNIEESDLMPLHYEFWRQNVSLI